MCLTNSNILNGRSNQTTQYHAFPATQACRETRSIHCAVLPKCVGQFSSATQNSGSVRLAGLSIASAPKVIHKRCPQKFVICFRLLPLISVLQILNVDSRGCCERVIAAVCAEVLSSKHFISSKRQISLK